MRLEGRRLRASGLVSVVVLEVDPRTTLVKDAAYTLHRLLELQETLAQEHASGAPPSKPALTRDVCVDARAAPASASALASVPEGAEDEKVWTLWFIKKPLALNEVLEKCLPAKTKTAVVGVDAANAATSPATRLPDARDERRCFVLDEGADAELVQSLGGASSQQQQPSKTAATSHAEPSLKRPRVDGRARTLQEEFDGFPEPLASRLGRVAAMEDAQALTEIRSLLERHPEFRRLADRALKEEGR